MLLKRRTFLLGGLAALGAAVARPANAAFRQPEKRVWRMRTFLPYPEGKVSDIPLSLLVPVEDGLWDRAVSPEIQRYMDALDHSIRTQGVQIPVTVTFDAKNQKYVIVHGVARYESAKRLGLERIPCYVTERRLTRDEIIMQNVYLNSHTYEAPERRRLARVQRTA